MKLAKQMRLFSILSLTAISIMIMARSASAITMDDMSKISSVIACTGGDSNGQCYLANTNTTIPCPDPSLPLPAPGTVELRSSGECVDGVGNEMGNIFYTVDMVNFDTHVTFVNDRGTLNAFSSGIQYNKAVDTVTGLPVMLLGGVADVTSDNTRDELGKYQHVTKILFNVSMDLINKKCIHGFNGLIEE